MMNELNELYDACFPPHATPQPRGANGSAPHSRYFDGPKPQPTSLQQAQQTWQDAQHHREHAEREGGNGYYRSLAEVAQGETDTLARLAIAEALTRIADALEDKPRVCGPEDLEIGEPF